MTCLHCARSAAEAALQAALCQEFRETNQKLLQRIAKLNVEVARLRKRWERRRK